MEKLSTKRIVLNGVMIALVFLATFFTRIPGPIAPGYINFGDTVIMVTAVLLGKYSGMAVGAFGSALADIFAPGGIIFAPITFIVKGLEGYIIGAIIHDNESRTTKNQSEINGVSISLSDKNIDSEEKRVKGQKTRRQEIRKIIAITIGALVMVTGYFFAELFILKLINPEFGYTAAVTELPFNLIQGGISAILGYVISTLLEKTGMHRLVR